MELYRTDEELLYCLAAADAGDRIARDRNPPILVYID